MKNDKDFTAIALGVALFVVTLLISAFVVGITK